MAEVGIYPAWAPKGAIQQNSTEYIKRFVVIQADDQDTPYTILELAGLPAMGDSGEHGTVLTRMSAEQDPDNGTKWTVEATYTTVYGTSLSPDANRHIRYRYRGEKTEVVAENSYDVDGNLTVPVLNLVNDPYDPPLMISKMLLVIAITKKRTGFTAADILTYQNTMNKGECEIDGTPYPPYTLVLRSLNPEPYYDNGGNVDYYLITAEVVYNPDTWKSSVLERGFRGTFSDGIRPIRLSDLNTNIKVKSPQDKNIDKPVRLGALGIPLAADAAASESVYTDFRVYKPISWVDLRNRYMD